MKNKLYGMLAFLLILCMLAGCGGDPVDTTSPDTSASVPETGEESTSASEDTTNSVEKNTIDESVLKDKIAGSWVAQMVGVTWAASTEFKYKGMTIPSRTVPKWQASMVNDAFNQDDLYVEIPFIDAMKDNGIDCSLDIIGKYFAESSFELWHANLIGRENLRNGIPAAEAGSYKNSYHADDIDWQIEADFLGNFYPGMVNAAAARSFEIGHLMNYGDGVYGGVYVAAMHAAAMTATSLRSVLDAGVKAIPEGTKFRAVIDDVEASYKNGDTWEECWQKIETKWNDDSDKCLECGGVMNIDAKLNAAYIHMGLLWGNGDFAETIKISMRCGQDSDCNPSSAAAILGTLYGLSGLPEEYKSDVDFNTSKFSYTNYTLQDCIDICFKLAEESIKKAGGTKDGTTWTLNVDKEVKPVAFEQWPDDEIVPYFTVSPKAEGKVEMSLTYYLPKDVNSSDIKVTLDMGDGVVLPFYVSGYTYTTPGTYTVTLKVSAGEKVSTVSKEIKVDFDPKGKGFKVTPSCSVTSPSGGGSRDISVIADGFVPGKYGNAKTQYDTFNNKEQTEAWYALQFDHKVTVTDVIFSEGGHFDDGGWFKKTPSVQVLVDGKWVDAETSVSPAYVEADDELLQGDAMQTFTFTLKTPVKCEGVRVIGEPGGKKTFVSCSELDIKYSDVENPTYKTVSDDCVQTAIIYVSESNPTGGGCKNAEVMRDGVIPTSGANNAVVQYDTYTNRTDDHEEFYGYIFRNEYKVSSVDFTVGATFSNGGWFKDGTLRLQALINGEWKDVNATVSPEYPNGDTQDKFTSFATYTFTVNGGVNCNGIRVIGNAGGSRYFTSVSEMSVSAAAVK